MIRPYGGLRVAVLLLPWVCTHGYIPSPLRGYDTPGRIMIRPHGGLRVAVLLLPWICTHGYIPSPLRGYDTPGRMMIRPSVATIR